MLLLHEAIEAIKSSEGQVLIPLKVLKLDKLTIEKIFVYVLKQYERKKPIRAKAMFPLSPEGVVIPDAWEVTALRPYAFFSFNKIAAPIDRKNWDWFEDQKLLKCLLEYEFEVTYCKEYTIGNLAVQYLGPSIYQTEDSTRFFLRGDFKKGTLQISMNGHSVKDIGFDANHNVILGGNLGHGTVNPETLEVNLKFSDNMSGTLDISFYSLYTAIQELSIGDPLFMLWFKVEFLKALGNIKKVTVIDGMPIDLSSDGLLGRAHQLEEKLEEQFSTKSSWWTWVN